MIKEITNKNFEDFISSDNLSIVKLGAEFCGPCRTVKPIIEKASNEIENIEIGEIDTESNMELARSLNVRSIPTTIFYKKGEALKTHVGAFSEEQFKNMIEELN